jgi:hypothetical protein
VLESVADPSSTVLELGHLGEDPGVHGEIRLHESNGGAWAEPLREMAKDGHWIRQIHQNKAADQRIERQGIRKLMEFRGLKTDVFIARFGDAPARPGDAVCVAIDAHHGTGGADQVRCNYGDISDTATKIKHAHPRRDSRSAKSAGQESTQDRALPHQALAFAITGAHGVIGRIWKESLAGSRHPILVQPLFALKSKMNYERTSESPTRRILPDSVEATRVLVAKR